MTDVLHFDVVIIGAGPAGLGAAVEAGFVTSSIAIIDQNGDAGGQIWRRDMDGSVPKIATEYLDRVARTATFITNATVIDAATANGRHRLLIDRSGQAMTFETGTIVLATGARELFLPFPGWTLPGVVGVGGLQALMKTGLDVREKRVVIAGTGPLLLAVAATAARKGAEIVGVVEQASLGAMVSFALRAATKPFVAAEAIRYIQRVPAGTMRFGSWVAAAQGADRLRGVTVASADGESHIECDYLACAYGLVPNLELPRLLGCAIGPRGVVVDANQATSVSGVFAAGECTGIGGVAKARAEGLIAGRSAVGRDTYYQVHGWLDSERRWGDVIEHTFAVRPEVLSLARPDTIVCRCEDVRLRDIDPAWSARQAKLYARAGMGPCQGRVCGAAMQQMFGWKSDTVRLPLQPTTVSSLRGAS